MRHRILALVLMLCLLALVGTGLAEDYFPLQIGNTWTYERWLKDAEGWTPTGKIWVVSVVDTVTVEGRNYFELVNYRKIMPLGHNITSDTLLVRSSGEKVFKYTSSAPEYGEPWKENLLYHFFDPSSVQVPEFYFVPRSLGAHNGFPQELPTETFPLGYGSLSVPAGSFHCYHHVLDRYAGGVLPEGLWFDVEGEWYEWFAPGIGLVQIYDFTGLRIEGYPSVYIRLNRAYVNGFSYPNSDTAIRETTWGEVKKTLK